MALIAIIDDNTRSRQLLERLLRQAGHVAVGTGTPQGAVDWLREMQPDLLVLDVDLPGTSGVDLLGTLRRDTALAKLPVVMLSGVMDLQVQAEAFQQGAADHILKGWNWERLLSRIERHCPAADTSAFLLG